MNTDEFVVFDALTDEGFATGHLDNVLLGIWRGDVTDERVDLSLIHISEPTRPY